MIDSTIQKSGFVSNTARLALGNVMAQVIILLTVPITTRLYSPASFGVLTLFLSVSSIITPISTLRLHPAILLPQRIEESYGVFILCILCSTCFFLAILVFSILMRLIGVHFPESYVVLEQYLYLLAIYIFIAGLYKSLNFIAVRRNCFKIQAVTRVGGTGLNKLFAILYCIVINDNPIGLLGGVILGHLLSVSLLMHHSINEFYSSIKLLSYSKLKALYKRYRAFAVYSGTALLENLSESIIPLLFACFFNPVIVGYIGLTRMAVRQPLVVLGDAISRSFYQKIAEAHRSARCYATYAYDLFRFLLSLTVVPTLLISAISPDVFSTIFGEKWRTAGYYFSIISISILSGLLYRTFSMILDVLERQRLRFCISSVRLLLNFVSICIGALYYQCPIYTLILYSVANTLIAFGTILYLIHLTGVSYYSLFCLMARQSITAVLTLGSLIFIMNYLTRESAIYGMVVMIMGGHIAYVVFSEKKIVSIIQIVLRCNKEPDKRMDNRI